MPVYFLGDAQAFGLGVYCVEHPDRRRILSITLGTGLGAGFIVKGRIGTEGENIPPNGQIWPLSFKDGILEDRISKRAIEKSYFERKREQAEVKDIAEYARSNDSSALESFSELAENIGEGLAGTIANF